MKKKIFLPTCSFRKRHSGHIEIFQLTDLNFSIHLPPPSSSLAWHCKIYFELVWKITEEWRRNKLSFFSSIKYSLHLSQSSMSFLREIYWLHIEAVTHSIDLSRSLSLNMRKNHHLRVGERPSDASRIAINKFAAYFVNDFHSSRFLTQFVPWLNLHRMLPISLAHTHNWLV